MKRFLAALVVSSLSCAPLTSTIEKVKPSTEATVQIINDNFLGASACPISAEYALTAKHVAEDRDSYLSEPKPSVGWFEDRQGNTGVIEAVDRYRGVDLALMRGDFKSWVSIATEFPKPGDTVYWVEFNFDNEKDAYAWKDREATVTVVKARHIQFRPKANPGASGSCLLNQNGELVGIVIRGISTKDGGMIGQAVGTVGFSLE